MGVYFTMEEIKKDKTLGLIETSAMCISGGYIISALYPPFIPIAWTMKAAGVLGIAYYGLTWSKFTKVFKTLGLGKGMAYPLYKGKKDTEYSEIYRFTLPAGLCLKDFEDKQEAIEQFIGSKIDIKYTFKEITIEVYKQDLPTMFKYEPTDIDGEVGILIGINRKGELITCDLSNGEPHMLIAGGTGSGKSTVLRAIITNLILKSNCKLHLIDLKSGAEFNVFSKCNKVITFSRYESEAEKVISDLICEIDRRYDLFYKYDVKDIKEYNTIFNKNKLDYEVLIIDEFADISNKGILKMLALFGRKARACGLHLILSTQRPDSKVLTGDIKANVTNVIGLKTKDRTNSQIIIDSNGLETLRGKGNALFRRNDIIEVQCPFISVNAVKELIKGTYIDKSNKKSENKKLDKSNSNNKSIKEDKIEEDYFSVD